MIGRFTALPYKLIAASIYRLLYFNFYTIGKAALAGYDHSVAVGHALDKLIGVVEATSELNTVVRHLVAVKHIHIFVAGACLFHNGSVGNHDILSLAEAYLHTGKHAGFEAFTGIGYTYFNTECARRRVDSGIDAVYFPENVSPG